MKCGKCGNNEANFHYTSNINGVRSEYHLCEVCAEETGLARELVPAIGELFAEPFGGFFGRGMFGSMPLMNGFFGGLPYAAGMLPVYIGSGTCGCNTRRNDSIPESADEEICARREITALRNQMKAAVKAEEFEKAAQLRDRLREMEANRQK